MNNDYDKLVNVLKSNTDDEAKLQAVNFALYVAELPPKQVAKAVVEAGLNENMLLLVYLEITAYTKQM